jgi:hypothetical protein
MRGVEKTALGQLLRLELELGSPFGGLTANKKSIERLALLADEALDEGCLSFGAEGLDLFIGELLFSDYDVDGKGAALAVLVATVEVVAVGAAQMPYFALWAGDAGFGG